jgi:hypothetical protein
MRGRFPLSYPLSLRRWRGRATDWWGCEPEIRIKGAMWQIDGQRLIRSFYQVDWYSYQRDKDNWLLGLSTSVVSGRRRGRRRRRTKRKKSHPQNMAVDVLS